MFDLLIRFETQNVDFYTTKCTLKTEACNKSIESTTANKSYPTSYNLVRWRKQQIQLI